MATILFASSDGALHGIFEAEIEGEGHTMLWAGDGQEAMELALAEQPDLVMLDLQLDIFDGLETCALLRQDPEIPRELPIVLLVSRDLDPHLVEKVGASQLFFKNHGAAELRETLSNYNLF